MPSAVATLLADIFPAIASTTSPLDCWVWKVIRFDPPMLADISAAIIVVEQYGHLDKLKRRIRQEHTNRRAHRAEDDHRLLDCITEACAFAWADLRGMSPQFDFGPGKPDIHVPPDMWIEAKEIHQSLRSQAMMDELRAGTLLSGSVAAPDQNRMAAFSSALADAKRKFLRLGSADAVAFLSLPDVDVEQWADRDGVLARYCAWLDQVEQSDPTMRIVFVHHYEWQRPIRDPFAG